MQGSATATSLMNELALFEETLQLSCVPPRSSAMALTTDERFLKEQTRVSLFHHIKTHKLDRTKAKRKT
jgi:hypothetical protein